MPGETETRTPQLLASSRGFEAWAIPGSNFFKPAEIQGKYHVIYSMTGVGQAKEEAQRLVALATSMSCVAYEKMHNWWTNTKSYSPPFGAWYLQIFPEGENLPWKVTKNEYGDIAP